MALDITSLLKTVAPWIGTALGGPLGGMALSAATSALGISDKTADGLKNALAGVTQTDILNLKKADQDFQVTMQTLGFKNTADLETIAAGDRASARDMEKATRSKVPAILSAVVTVGFFGVLGGMLWPGFKLADNQALFLLLGSLSAAFGAVIAYWFGTSHESIQKTDMIANSTPNT